MAAPPPKDEVAICNLALARLGQDRINSIESPTTHPEDICALHYPMTRRRLLRGPRIFGFAKKLAALTVDSGTTPDFGYEAAFQLPNDYLRLLSLGDYTINAHTPVDLYDIVGNHIYTDEEDDTDQINISYIFDETRVARWDSIFVNLMRLELARDMSYAFTLRASLIRQLDEELKDVRLEAGAVSGQENPPRRIQRSRVRDVRRHGGLRRDPTRHWI